MVLVAIPARIGSTRLPRKPLCGIAGKTLIERVVERASHIRTPHHVLVVTDSEEIAHALLGAGCEVRLTSAAFASGTDRIASVLADFKEDIVVNVQGDEPLFPFQSVDEAIAMLQTDVFDILTVRAPFSRREEGGFNEWQNPNTVKVVVDQGGKAFFFSRNLYANHSFEGLPVFRHIGIYAMRRERFLEFARLPHSPLERLESLEQMRALEAGWKIGTVLTTEVSQSVDTQEDVEKVIRLFSLPEVKIKGPSH